MSQQEGTALDALFALPYASLAQAEKERQLFPLLRDGLAYHRAACPAFDRIVARAFPDEPVGLDTLPYLPISLFKDRRLLSVPATEVRVAVQSSGTSASGLSQVALTADDARRTARSLASILKTVLGPVRLPMLFIDTPDVLKGGGAVGARAAAILGLMPYGRDHRFVLNEAWELDENALLDFLAKNGSKPFVIYGFTFLVWQALAPFCASHRVDLSNALLLHSGGWKKLQSLAVDNAAFRHAFAAQAGLTHIVNFYGMAEMPGVVFLENADGLFYPPSFADVLIRDPVTLAPLPVGQAGLVQWINPLPRSYPGLSVLTEDLGIVETIDSNVSGWKGQALRLIGRAPKAEMRGCSDVLAQKISGEV